MRWPCMSTEKYPQHMPLLGEAMAGGLCLPAIALACPLVPRSGRRAQARRAGGVSRVGRDIFTAMEFIGCCVFFG